MEDEKIIELYFERDEAAADEAQSKYGGLCRRIAMNLLADISDAEECVNDVFLRAWQRIPPERPEDLGAWLGKVTHDTAINLWNKNHAQKRYSPLTAALDELQDSVPSRRSMEREVEDRELGAVIDRWLGTLSRRERRLFVRRYWYGIPLNELADEIDMDPKKLAGQMYRLRRSLRSYLEKEDHFYE